jgi:hypothetical protein
MIIQPDAPLAGIGRMESWRVLIAKSLAIVVSIQ